MTDPNTPVDSGAPGTPRSTRRRRSTTPLVVAGAAVAVAASVVGVGAATPDEPRVGAGHSSGTPRSSGTPGTASSNPGTASPTPGQPSTEPAVPKTGDLARRIDGDPYAKGRVDAPVVMIAYSEFQCPFCGKFARDTEPELQRYLDDGTLRIEWRDFPYLGDESVMAAKGGRAAAAQDRFWEYHRRVFEGQPAANNGIWTEAYLIKLADQLGLDTKRFAADLRSRATADAVAKDTQEGQTLGVQGTPSFVINDIPVVGAQPAEVFTAAIDQAAAAAKQ